MENMCEMYISVLRLLPSTRGPVLNPQHFKNKMGQKWKTGALPYSSVSTLQQELYMCMAVLGSRAGSRSLCRCLKDCSVNTSEHSAQVFSLINFDTCDGGEATTKLQQSTFPSIPKFSLCLWLLITSLIPAGRKLNCILSLPISFDVSNYPRKEFGFMESLLPGFCHDYFSGFHVVRAFEQINPGFCVEG